MERNADDTFGAAGAQGTNTGGTSGFGSSEVGSAGADTGYSTGTGTAGTTAAPKLDQAKAKAQDAVGQVKEKARALQSTLADRLDAGADKLRQRTQGTQGAPLAGATGTGTVDVASEDKMVKMQDSLARGMNKSADWLRNGDLKADIEKQVRENPGRTLLVALGIGYVLGKAFRGRR